jgi:putative membrane protein
LSKTERKRWHRTSPLAVIFYAGKVFEAIAKNAVQSLAPLVAFLVASEGPILTRIAIGGSIFLSFVAAASLARYWFFRYSITGNSILIREGMFRKKQLDIKFDRIQAVDTEQNVLYRALGLVTVKFDTAGSARQEGYLPAIRVEIADSLRARIRRTRPAGHESDETASDEATEVLRLATSDMFRIGLSSNRALIVLVLLGPVIDQVETRVGKALEDHGIDEALEGVAAAADLSVLIAVGIIVGLLSLLVVASIIGAFLRYHGFTLVWDKEILRSSGGLITRHEQSVGRNKIQSFEATQNPALRLFRRFRLLARRASSGKPGGERDLTVPVSDAAATEAIAAQIFAGEFPGAEFSPTADGFQPISTRYIRSRVLLTGVIPALLLALPLTAVAGVAGLTLLAWIPLSALLAWRIYRRYGFICTRDGLVLRRGFAGYRLSAFLHRKVQRISVTQSPGQRRNGLATIRFYLAFGTLKLPYVDFPLAKGLRDHVLYRVESSQLAWH